MARKKKGAGAMPMPPSGSDRMSTDISTAENGFIVSVSGETGGKTPSYFSKRFIATSRPRALRLANQAMACCSTGATKSKGGKKKSKSGALLKKLA
jgi:hypothetical protein